MKNLTLTIATLIVTVAGLAMATPQDSSDLTAVEAVAMQYLTSGQTGDVERLRQAFHPSARLQFVKEGQYGEWSGKEFIGWRKPGKKSQYDVRVLRVDCAGTAAMAKVEMDFGHKRYIDYLSFLKIDGRWWIVNKIFHEDKEVK